jgi:hypothetical protein
MKLRHLVAAVAFLPVLASAQNTFTRPAYATVQDEGANLQQWSILDCVGAGITCSNDAVNRRTLVTVSTAGSVTSVATGLGLQGGPITTTGTVDLRLNASGGLVKNLGAGSNELGIGAGAITASMLGAGTYGIDISGNAATVTNGVYTTGAYADPAWITSLAASKLTGTVATANGGTAQNSSAWTGVPRVSSGTWSNLTLNDGQIIMGATGGAPAAGSLTCGGGVSCSGGANSITIGTTAGGDLSGSLLSAQVIKLYGRAVQNTNPADLNGLVWNNGASEWRPTAIVNSLLAGTGISLTGSTGNVTVANIGTLQNAYSNSSANNAKIVVDSTRNGVVVQDADGGGIGGVLFSVKTSAAAATPFSVSSTGSVVLSSSGGTITLDGSLSPSAVTTATLAGTKETLMSIGVMPSTTLSAAGGFLALVGGTGADGSGVTPGANGGTTTIAGGPGGAGTGAAAAGAGGGITVAAGSAGTSGGGGNANGGAASLSGGAGSLNGNGGAVTINGGSKAGTGTDGAVNIATIRGAPSIGNTSNISTISGGIANTHSTSAKNANYTIVVGDHYVPVTTTAGVVTVTLPAPGSTTAKRGWSVVVLDEGGSAAASNITISPSGAEKINGVAASISIASNYGWKECVTNQTDWFCR